jgi:hypothetical protein
MVAKGPSIGQNNFDVLKAHLEDLDTMSTEEKCEVCRFCRVDRMWKQDLKRITMSILSPKVREAILDGLKQLGAERKSGRAPAGNMERQLQGFLEKLFQD